jgi:hypothetical protein
MRIKVAIVIVGLAASPSGCTPGRAGSYEAAEQVDVERPDKAVT